MNHLQWRSNILVVNLDVGLALEGSEAIPRSLGLFLPDIKARKKLFASRVTQLVDLTLDEVLSLASTKLAKKIETAQVIVVRSQEIDRAGEAGFNVQARQVMDTVIDNIARAVRNPPGVPLV